MQEAGAVYLVRFWVKPGDEARVLDWLDNGHIADVVSQPGFLWARRYRLAADDADGWPAYAMVYGLESMAHLEAYFESAAARGYAEERKALGLDPLLRMDRNWGVVEYAVDA
jgi:quinol monooxygenase YgiN